MVVIAVILAVLGLAAGSFINALVWRLRQQTGAKGQKAKRKELSILKGRSMCPNCRHTLAWYDLVPILSYLGLGGRCRYCQKLISRQYPLVEALMALVFVLSYVFWPSTVHQGGQWLLLAMWLTAAVGLLALAVYDLRWMLLPNRILYPTLAAAVIGRAVYIGVYAPRPGHAVALWAGSVAIASGFFYALYIISRGQWIGFGDVRLGLITGTLLADPYESFLMIFLASLLGSLSAVPDLARRKKTISSRLPYGPFLIFATGICILFGPSIINWYKGLFGL